MLAVENQASCEKAEHTTVQNEETGSMSPMANDTSLGEYYSRCKFEKSILYLPSYHSFDVFSRYCLSFIHCLFVRYCKYQVFVLHIFFVNFIFQYSLIESLENNSQIICHCKYTSESPLRYSMSSFNFQF